MKEISGFILIAFSVIQMAVCLAAMHWLYKRFKGNTKVLVSATTISALVLSALAVYSFISYALAVLMIVLLARNLKDEHQHPKYGGLILGLFFGFFLTVPVGVYQFSTFQL